MWELSQTIRKKQTSPQPSSEQFLSPTKPSTMFFRALSDNPKERCKLKSNPFVFDYKTQSLWALVIIHCYLPPRLINLIRVNIIFYFSSIVRACPVQLRNSVHTVESLMVSDASEEGVGRGPDHSPHKPFCWWARVANLTPSGGPWYILSLCCWQNFKSLQLDGETDFGSSPGVGGYVKDNKGGFIALKSRGRDLSKPPVE